MLDDAIPTILMRLSAPRLDTAIEGCLDLLSLIPQMWETDAALTCSLRSSPDTYKQKAMCSEDQLARAGHPRIRWRAATSVHRRRRRDEADLGQMRAKGID